MTMDNPLLQEAVWYEKWRCNDAEMQHQIRLCGGNVSQDNQPSRLVSEIERARQQIQNSLKTNKKPTAEEVDNTIVHRIETLEQENKELRKVTEGLKCLVQKLESRIKSLEVSDAKPAAPSAAAAQETEKKDEGGDEEDDDFELFGDDDDEVDEAAEKLKEERVKMYTEKKAKKTAIIAKSNIILDVKPWDDETDMAEMEKLVRTVEMEGLLWGNSKLVPLAYGIKKLQISCVVVDDLVGTDDLEEKITEFEDFVQSVDIAAFNKI